MKKDDEIFESLIAGGLIGAALGALVAKEKGDGATLGALAGAVLLATFKANKQAQETKLPMFIEENGSLYEVSPNGKKVFIKPLEKSTVKLSQYFKLK